MKKGYEIGGRHRDDPIGSEKPRGKSRSQRKAARDGPSWTGTEARQRDQLMKQFCKLEGPAGNSEAYISAPCWCDCGRLVIRDGKCARCLQAVAA